MGVLLLFLAANQFSLTAFFLPLLTSIIFSMIDNITKLVCWNYRGLSGRDTSSRIKYMMKNINPIIFCLVETCVDNNRLDSFCLKLDPKCDWAAIVADGYLGGIIVTW